MRRFVCYVTGKVQIASRIYDKYMADKAPVEVNLSSATKEETKNAIQAGCTQTTFDKAKAEVIYMLKTNNTFSRYCFLKLKFVITTDFAILNFTLY